MPPSSLTLERRLTERFGNHRHVGDIRGRGLFQAIELVADRASRAPFDSSLKLNQRIKAAAFERGLACYPAGGTVDGRSGDHVLLAPPYISTSDDIDMIVDRLGAAVDSALKAVGH
jgi:adenosylmethionine-8-amino-7-oxononanoate aminotransferase